jgi:hypothetical protein
MGISWSYGTVSCEQKLFVVGQIRNAFSFLSRLPVSMVSGSETTRSITMHSTIRANSHMKNTNAKCQTKILDFRASTTTARRNMDEKKILQRTTSTLDICAPANRLQRQTTIPFNSIKNIVNDTINERSSVIVRERNERNRPQQVSKRHRRGISTPSTSA